MRLAATSLLTIPAILLMSSPPPSGIKVQVNGGAVQTVTQLNFVNGGNTTVAVKPSNGVALIRYNASVPVSIVPPSATATTPSGLMPAIADYKGHCVAGQVFFDGAQPIGRQLYLCTKTDTLLQMGALYDASLILKDGALYANTDLLASLGDAQTFRGRKSFLQPIDLLPQGDVPAPDNGISRLYQGKDNRLHYKTSDGQDHAIATN